MNNKKDDKIFRLIELVKKRWRYRSLTNPNLPSAGFIPTTDNWTPDIILVSIQIETLVIT